MINLVNADIVTTAITVYLVSVASFVMLYLASFKLFDVVKLFRAKVLMTLTFYLSSIGYLTLPFFVFYYQNPIIPLILTILGLAIPFVSVRVSLKRILRYVPFLLAVYDIVTTLWAVQSFLLIYLLQIYKEKVKIERFGEILTLSQILIALTQPVFCVAFYSFRYGNPNEVLIASFALMWLSVWLSILYSSSILYDIVRRWT